MSYRTGNVTAFEIEEHLADRARDNLKPFEGVTVINADASTSLLPKSDVVYVNAGVTSPPVEWLRALKQGGRLIFPWRPTEEVGLTLMVRAETKHFSVTSLMPSWFIPCVGASDATIATKVPSGFEEARLVRSIWKTTDKAPDETAVAIYPNVWFSRAVAL